MDLFEKRFGECVQATGFFDTLSSVSKLVSLETLGSIGQCLVKAHKPSAIDFAAKFGLRDLDRRTTRSTIVDDRRSGSA